MKVVILQPGYLPWLGFFEQMIRSDIFVIYDDVQFDRRGWRNRNRVKSTNGQVWLTVPVLQKGHFGQKVNEVMIDNSRPWIRKHMNTLLRAYSRSRYFDKYFHGIENILFENHQKLFDLDIRLIYLLAHWLGEPEVKFHLASEFRAVGDRSSRLLNICRKLGADSYYTGAAAKAYLDVGMFQEEGIRVDFQDYLHPEYPQLFGEFIPYMSLIDLLFNTGDNAREIIMSGAHQKDV